MTAAQSILGKLMKNKIKSKVSAQQWNRYLAQHEFRQRRVTFGMFTGKMIQELNTEYLKWGTMNLDEYWATQFARELQQRDASLRKLGAVK